MRIRHALLLAFAVTALAVGAYALPVFAQSGGYPTGFKNVTLWINPEYDDPRLLVMLEGKVVGINTPARVRFLVPAAAEMFSAGSKDAQGKYSGGPPDRKASQIPGWDEISYELKTDTFRVEYYDPVISGQPDKKISYDFRSLYPVSDLRVMIQEPRKASNFTVVPKGATGIDGEGFTVQSYNYSNLVVDQPLHFDIAYTKTDPNPSITNPQLNSGDSGSSKLGLTLGLILGGILIAIVFAWLLKSRQKHRYAAQYAARKAQTRASKRRSPKERFCSQCGQPVDRASQYCQRCGNRLGKSD